MNIAVLSDIHGNHVALEKCVQSALDNGVERFLFLGDYLGELAFPQKTMEIIYSLKEQYQCWFIKGNKEDYWLGYDNTWKEYDSTTGALYYTYHQLTEQDLTFFKGLKICENIILPGLPEITACHGSPEKVNEKMLPNNERTFSVIEKNDSDYIVCGHTHIQNVMEHNGKRVWNPGSVGVSVNGQGKAQFLILKGESSKWRAEFFSADYAVEQVIKELHRSGLYEKAPGWCSVTEHLLRTGETPHGSVLGRAMFLCSQAEGSCRWPDIPEKYWRQAVGEMIG